MIEANAVNEVSRFTNSDACSSATRRRLRRRAGERRKKRVEPRARVGQVARNRLEIGQSGTNAAIAVLTSWPRPAKPPPKPSSELREPTPRLVVEHAEHVVELHHRRRPGGLGSSRPGAALPSPRPGSARCTSGRATSAGAPAASIRRAGSISLSSFIVTCAYAEPSSRFLGSIFEMSPPARRRSEPRSHARAERRSAGPPSGRRWHERQARVRVVGQEDRDDRHQHGHGSDQDRAGGEGGLAAARAHCDSPPAGSRARPRLPPSAGETPPACAAQRLEVLLAAPVDARVAALAEQALEQGPVGGTLPFPRLLARVRVRGLERRLASTAAAGS